MFASQQSQSYLNDLMSYQNSSPLEIPNAILDAISTYTDKKKKPKRNRSAFILFSIDIRKKQNIKALDELNPNDKFVKIAELWKEADEETRQHYEQKAKQEKLKYATELSDFCKTFPTEPIQRPRNYIKKPCNAYGYFLKEMKEEIRKQNPEMRMCEVLRIVGEKWKQLSAENKEKYELQAEASKKNFKEEVTKQMEAIKKVKTDNGTLLVQQGKKSPVMKIQESLVCKDIDMPEFPVVEKTFERATTTSVINNAQFNFPKYIQEPVVVNSPPVMPAENFAAAFAASFKTLQQQSAYPKSTNMLEGLYWKVEGLRQQILSQMQNNTSQRGLPFMGYNGYQMFGGMNKYMNMNWEQVGTYSSQSPSSSEGDECKKEESH